MWRHLANLLMQILPPTRFFWLRRFLLRSVGIDIESSSRVCGRTWIYGRGEIHIGSNSWVGLDTFFYSNIDAPIRIGANCDIGPANIFVTGSHVIGMPSRRAGLGTSASITIGDGCWLGARVTVLGGVKIGNGAIVAAGALVSADVAPHTMVGGIPARLIRNLSIVET